MSIERPRSRNRTAQAMRQRIADLEAQAERDQRVIERLKDLQHELLQALISWNVAAGAMAPNGREP